MFLGSWRISETGCRLVSGLDWQLRQAGRLQRADLLADMQQTLETLQRVYSRFRQNYR